MRVKFATIWSLVFTSVIPAIFFTLSWLSMQTSDWDTNDSGVAQGFAFGLLGTLATLFCIAAFFPLVAVKLGGEFTKRKWVYCNLVIVLVVSFTVSTLFHIIMGIPSSGLMMTLPSIISFTLLLFVMAGVLMIPAMVVWLWLSKATHNSTLQRTPLTLRR
jgi:hypothetical protein